MVSNKIIVVLAVALTVALAISIYYNYAFYLDNKLTLRRFNYSITFVSELRYTECPPDIVCYPVAFMTEGFEFVLLIPLDQGRSVSRGDAMIYRSLNLSESIGGYLYTDGVISKYSNDKLEIIGPIVDRATNENNFTTVTEKTYYRYSGEVDLIYLQGTQKVFFYTSDQFVEMPPLNMSYGSSYGVQIPP